VVFRSILYTLQFNRVDFADGVVAPESHKPFAEQKNFVGAAGGVALLKITGAERAGLQAFEPGEQASSLLSFGDREDGPGAPFKITS